jgi:hypothetical protein
MPKWQGTISSYWDIRILHVFVVILFLSVIIITGEAGLRKGECRGSANLLFQVSDARQELFLLINPSGVLTETQVRKPLDFWW